VCVCLCAWVPLSLCVCVRLSVCLSSFQLMLLFFFTASFASLLHLSLLIYCQLQSYALSLARLLTLSFSLCTILLVSASAAFYFVQFIYVTVPFAFDDGEFIFHWTLKNKTLPKPIDCGGRPIILNCNAVRLNHTQSIVTWATLETAVHDGNLTIARLPTISMVTFKSLLKCVKSS